MTSKNRIIHPTYILQSRLCVTTPTQNQPTPINNEGGEERQPKRSSHCVCVRVHDIYIYIDLCVCLFCCSVNYKNEEYVTNHNENRNTTATDHDDGSYYDGNVPTRCITTSVYDNDSNIDDDDDDQMEYTTNTITTTSNVNIVIIIISLQMEIIFDNNNNIHPSDHHHHQQQQQQQQHN